MNLFDLAEVQLIKEGREVSRELVLDYAVRIRRWLDKHRGVADKILAGGKVYQYGNRIVVSSR